MIDDIYRGDTRKISLTLRKDSPVFAGILKTTVSGAVNIVDALITGPFPKRGILTLETCARESQSIEFTDWTASGTRYNFTVNDNLDFIFDEESTKVTVDCARIDLTGAAIKMTVVDANNTVVISKDATILNAIAGEAVIELTPTDTDLPVAKYTYDIQLTDENGDVTTLMYGTFNIKQEVTQ